jgi:prepilin-type N-terminal cleavage/methylation domain-containing protein
MKAKEIIKSQQGFTLVEIIAVLIILGILAAVAVPRYIDLEQNARSRAFDAAVSELNGRESLIWADIKISKTGYTDDSVVRGVLNARPPEASAGVGPWLGDDYVWTADAKIGDNPLTFKKTTTLTLTRTTSTSTGPATWRRPS